MKNLFFALALLVFGWTAQSAQAATNGFLWKHFGADPYATTKVVGMQTREKAFGCLGIPQGAIDLLMKETDHDGETVRLVKGDHLDKMLSKGCVVHANVTVAFTAPVHNMEYAAPGERWSVVFNGKRYTVTRPDICNNWSVVITILPTPPAPPVVKVGCLEIHVFVPPHHTLHRDLAARRLEPPTVCKGLKVEHGHGHLTTCNCGFDDALGDLRAKGYLLNLQPKNSYEFQCEDQENGCVLIEQVPASAGTRNDDDIYLFCLIADDGIRGLVKDVHWYAYKLGIAYVGLAPAEWLKAGGVARVWHDAD